MSRVRRGRSLGLKFTPVGDRITVLQINPGTQAEKHPELHAGMTLLSIAETSAAGMEYKEVINLLKVAPRPVTLSFKTVDKKKKPKPDKKKNPEGEKLRAWLADRGLALYTEAVLLSFLKAGYPPSDWV